jgi:sugar lactone lactonase YvrE
MLQTTSIGRNGSTVGELSYPSGVAIDKDNLYVADTYNNCIQKFSLSMLWKLNFKN